ncbi:MAG: cobaltochelatase subunit CobN [Marinifilaceae bacterium]|jgi:cobaltochelatase CobN|nr:cobaltochelatase subunit CobN [Marinifilaceae bacterium]
MKKKIIILATIFIILVAGFFTYNKFISTTRIGSLNFPDFTVEKFARSNNNPWIKIDNIKIDDIDAIDDYDMLLVRIHGSSLTKKHLSAIKKAIKKGIPVYSTESDNKEINSLSKEELRYISTLMNNGSIRNYKSMFNFIRKKIDKKLLFNKDYEEPVIIPNDYFFHTGEDEFFASYKEYQEFYKKSNKYKKRGPRVALLSGNINIQNSNKEHMVAIIKSLEDKGINVYPISSFGMKKLKMIKEVNPDLIINRPHGRLVMGGGESGNRLLEKLNVPILAPLTVSDLYSNWLTSKQGMKSGGMTSMSVVLPELDGAIAPFAIAAQFEKNGRRIFDAIPKHTEKFCKLVSNYLKLRIKKNKNKKIAIYYFKGVGKGAISAADIEGVESLYNTLCSLKKSGYNLDGLPSNINDFKRLINEKAPVLGPYALGAFDNYLKHGNPELVNVNTFNKWINNNLPKKLGEDLVNTYGEAPGKYMAVEKDGKKYIAVARLQFGNVCILPQPLPAVGNDIQKLVHGVDKAPAYPYVASYMWTRLQFGADAIMHFGTHGSLEFIPGKQIALSGYDWTDALIGDMPHFYIYTTSNIGEGIIAKRRSYACLISHLTAAFMQGELYDNFKILQDRIHKMEDMEDGNLKDNYRRTISKLAKKENIQRTLNLDSTRILNDEEIEKVHMYIEEINNAKVKDGLYTLGESYSKENINNTARLISYDPVRYGLANLDLARKKISEKDIDNSLFIAHHYNKKTDLIIKRALRNEDSEKILSSYISKKEMRIYKDYLRKERIKREKRKAMMGRMMKMMSRKKSTSSIKFLDKKGNLLIIKDNNKKKKHKGMSAMQRMASAKPVSMNSSKKDDSIKILLSAINDLNKVINNVNKSRNNLKISTDLEKTALLNAFSGGYTRTGSAGDPILNPSAIPTGRNFYSINPETTPTAEAWQVGKKLTNKLLENELRINKKYPEKVSFTLWSTDFIANEGSTIAEIFYLLGVEPLRDGFGYIRSLRLIPQERLKRPRIDVVIQTSGQLRDIAASRLALINKAIAIAASSDGENNFVRKGVEDAERYLLEKGYSPLDAKKFAKERIFGGVNGAYGTGIMGRVESGDSWESRDEIANQYINNMGAMYSENGGKNWGDMKKGVFEAALLNTSVVVQPRSSNTWGPLSLDHVYEFMGGLSLAVKKVTNKTPRAYFNDFRNHSNARVQNLKEAIGVETSSTVFNPKYIKEMMKGSASAMESFAETFRNTYGWNSMRPEAIDQHIWNKYYRVYVKDEYKLNLKKTFKAKNPYALQEMTAVMLESARKGMWKASESQLKDVAKLHSQLVKKHQAGCSGFICNNKKLRKFISKQLPKVEAKEYQKNIKQALEVKIESKNKEKNVVLKKEEQKQTKQKQKMNSKKEDSNNSMYLYGLLGLLILVVLIVRRKRK